MERNIIKESIASLIRAYAGVKVDADTIARRIERSCYNNVIKSCIADGVDRLFTDQKFLARYSAICSKCIANIDQTSAVGSNYLIDKIISNSIDVNTIADMTSIELCPESSKDVRDDINLRLKQVPIRKVSTKYTCKKCGCKESIFTEYQARASDEAGTISIKCVQCTHVFRQ